MTTTNTANTTTNTTTPNTAKAKPAKLTPAQRAAMVQAAVDARQAGPQGGMPATSPLATEPAAPAPAAPAPAAPAPAAEQPAKPALVRYAKDLPTNPATVIKYNQANPKKPGSASHTRYEAYKAATTIGQAKALGALRDDLRWDAARGYLTVVG